MSIRLSPKYGVNPSVTHCFWCGESTGIVLVGAASQRVFGREEAPMSCIMGMDPCEACLKFAEDGYVTVKATTIDQTEMARRGFLLANGNLDLEGQAADIMKVVTDHLWRIRVEKFNEVFTGMDTDRNRFLMTSMEVVRAVGLPESPEELAEMEGGGDHKP